MTVRDVLNAVRSRHPVLCPLLLGDLGFAILIVAVFLAAPSWRLRIIGVLGLVALWLIVFGLARAIRTLSQQFDSLSRVQVRHGDNLQALVELDQVRTRHVELIESAARERIALPHAGTMRLQ